MHSFTCSFKHSFSVHLLICSLCTSSFSLSIQPFIYPLPCSLSFLLTWSHIPSLVHSLTLRSFVLIHSPTNPLAHSFVHPFLLYSVTLPFVSSSIHSSSLHFLIRWLSQLLVRSFTHAFICSLIHPDSLLLSHTSLTYSFIHSFIHSLSFLMHPFHQEAPERPPFSPQFGAVVSLTRSSFSMKCHWRWGGWTREGRLATFVP